jgi:predicted permease
MKKRSFIGISNITCFMNKCLFIYVCYQYLFPIFGVVSNCCFIVSLFYVSKSHFCHFGKFVWVSYKGGTFGDTSAALLPE